MTKSDLREERAALDACLTSYDSLIAIAESSPTQSVPLVKTINSSEVIAQVRKLTIALDAVRVSDLATSEQPAKHLFRTFFGLRIPLLICATMLIASLLVLGVWSIYRLPSSRALEQIHGNWQKFEVHDTGETEKQFYRSFTATKMTTSGTPQDQKWYSYDRRIELIPATDFFVLRITELPNDRPVAGAEYYVKISDDKIHEIRGIHQMDPMRQTAIYLWRPVTSIPSASSSRRELK